MEFFYLILLGILYIFLFFSGWAAVFFISVKAITSSLYRTSMWRQAVGWGCYFAAMLGYPATVLLLTGLVIHKFTGE